MLTGGPLSCHPTQPPSCAPQREFIDLHPDLWAEDIGLGTAAALPAPRGARPASEQSTQPACDLVCFALKRRS